MNTKPRPEIAEMRPKISVIGVGGGGGNAVNNMIAKDLQGAEFIVANTDAQALTMSKAGRLIQLGVHVTEGLGAGSLPEVGQAAALESIDEIMDHLSGTHMCFVTAGMGGGTGTGAAPVVAEIAKDCGALTIGVVTKPFAWEGSRRMRQAEEGLERLRGKVDTLIAIPNARLMDICPANCTVEEAFETADDVLRQAIQSISNIISSSGSVNLDFNDIRTTMSEAGPALLAVGSASGDDRAVEAAKAATHSPLLDNVSIAGATGVLVNITGGADLTLGEVHQINEIIHDAVGDEAEIIFGAVHEPAMQGEIRVTVIATGFDKAIQPGLVTPAAEVSPVTAPKSSPVIPFPGSRPSRVGGSLPARPANDIPRAPRTPAPPGQPGGGSQDLSDMEIPTFIRRQMD
jgi:cell division protein FtsZ